MRVIGGITPDWDKYRIIDASCGLGVHNALWVDSDHHTIGLLVRVFGFIGVCVRHVPKVIINQQTYIILINVNEDFDDPSLFEPTPVQSRAPFGVYS